MGKLILKTEIKRQIGLLYYCSTSKDGYITVCEAVMARGRKKKVKKVIKKKK